MYSTTALPISMQFCSAGTFPQNDLQCGQEKALPFLDRTFTFTNIKFTKKLKCLLSQFSVNDPTVIM